MHKSDLAEVTSEVVAAYIAQNHAQPGELPALIASVHDAFSSLGKPVEAEVRAEPLKPFVPIKRSVTDEYIISLEDGRKFQSLASPWHSRDVTGRLPREVGLAS